MSFVGLHTHSDYSLLDGASQLDQLVERAIALGMPAIALTDHGVMYGAIELIKTCRTRNIKPIVGNEMYIFADNVFVEKAKKKEKKYHQVVLAKNTQGYKNLVKLTTISHLTGMKGSGIFARPCIKKEELEQYHEGLIVTSGCRAGEVPQYILAGKIKEAKEIAKWYKKLFGEDYYLEIQDHGYPEDRVVNVQIVKIAKELKIKVIATNDSHFTSCSDAESHDALLCVQTGQLVSETKRMRYSGTEYLKSAEEMKLLFRDHLTDDVIQEAINNTLEVADKVKSYDIFNEPRLPDYPIPPGHTPATYVEEKTKEGLIERLKAKSYTEVSQEYKERLEYELKMIERMGFSTYFLVVWDYIKFARDNHIPVGPGRGSAAGSLVAYSLRITNIDPVHHGLLFERFLNPERKSMPDIDTDFCIDNREEVIKYVTNKYGTDNVSQIITFNRMTSKAVLKDVGRVLNVPYSMADKMAKLIPVSRGKPTKLKVMISDDTPEPQFKEFYDNESVDIKDNQGNVTVLPVKNWVDMAIRIEGTNKNYGVHAAGVVISAQPLTEIVPLQKNGDGSVITQYFMEDLESLGLLKMDFLGLRNLTIIEDTIRLIQETTSLVIDPDEIIKEERRSWQILSKGEFNKRSKDVERTYALIERGDLDGVFQLESSGMLDVVQKLKPTSIEDISSILALYRPGPLDAGLIPKFIDRKHGREKIEYEHKSLEPILHETYGILCLPKGTLINRPNGNYTPIEDIKSGDLILTSNGEKVWAAKVAKQWKSGVKEILKITLSSGKVIYSSTKHRFLTPEGDKFADELKPALTGLQNAYIYASTLYEKWQISTNKKKLGKNQAYLLGLFLGDGNLVSSTPNICCSTEKTAQWVANLIYKTWGGEAKYYFHTRCWYAYSKFNTAPNPTPLTQFMNKIYHGETWKVKSTEKHLPEDILDYCERDRIDLLKGLWDSDGCYSERLIYFRSASARLLQQVANLLSSLKISYYLGSNYVYIADKTRFNLMLGKTQLPDKLYGNIPDNYMPIVAEELAVLLTDSINNTDSNTRKLVKKALGNATLFKPKKSEYQTKLEDWGKFYHQLYEKTYLQDVRPVYVVSIEKCENAECFDLEMEDQNSPYFLAQDIITHNCYQEQIMKIAQDLAGYSLGQADLLRRAMGKKKPEEMKKQQEIFIEGSAKNGIPRIVAENLFDQMIKFAEYCFNKSHSTAYAYVTYQTAYLKANYPLEYMTALLTANSDDQDKLTKYLSNCEKLNINISPPDINESATDFKPIKKNNESMILFGLSAVRNVGEAAIKNILDARNEGGKFASLADLCDRVQGQSMNKKLLEALIKCGAFDNLQPNRSQLLADLELLLPWAQSRAKDKEIGQGNLFDLLGGGSKSSSKEGWKNAPKAPNTKPPSSMEKLEWEKEFLGLYVSDHPLKAVKHLEGNIKPDVISINEMLEKKSGKVSLIVLLLEVKIVNTKKTGDRMAILKMEDLTGQGEAVVFPRNYEVLSDNLKTDCPLILKGKIDRKDGSDNSQLIVEEVQVIKLEDLQKAVTKSEIESFIPSEQNIKQVEIKAEEILPKYESIKKAIQVIEKVMLILEMTPDQVNEKTLKNLKSLLQENGNNHRKDNTEVRAIVADKNKQAEVRLGKEYWVENSEMALQSLKGGGFSVISVISNQ